ncbi:MAG TPA: sodium:solute symporter family protein [Lamprocystis sp. (in: g-proteobacteria)]|nr:sodium:solute symporter family protein [Lamprocystis sp. (in: g-proteobacteria)]
MTSLQYWLWLIVGGSVVLYLIIALRSRARSTNDFYVAGAHIHPIANGMATAADWLSAASFISMAGLIAFGGYDASVYLLGWTGGYVLLALLLAPYLRKFGKFTVPEFIGERYYSNAARLVAVVCLLVISITYVIGQMKGVGVVFSRFLEVDFNVGVLIGMAIIFVYAVIGGMKAITYTQIAQYCVLVFAYTIPAIFISLQLTNHPVPQLGLGSEFIHHGVPSGVSLLDTLDQVVTDLGFGAYTAQQDSTLNLVLLTLSLMIGTAGLPHIITRFFTVPTVAGARSSAGWALLFIAVLYTTAPAIGAMARLNLTDTIQTGPVGGPTANLELTQVPDWMKRWRKTGLLDWQDQNGDGRIQYYDDQNPAFAPRAADFGWKGNELIKIDRDIMVLANPEIAHLPDWVIALVAAGGLAAALSTAAGLLLAIASAISHDLLKGIVMPHCSDRTELLAGRIGMAAAVLVAGYLGINPPGFAAEVVALAFGLAAASLFPALMLGIFDRRANRAGAILGMLSGLFSTLTYLFWFKGWFFTPGTERLANSPDNWLLGISPEAFGAVGAAINFGVAYVVSRLTSEPPQAIQDLVDAIRIPKDAGLCADH